MSVVWIDCILLIHSPISAHLDGFHILAPVNNAAVNLSVQIECMFLHSGGNAVDVITYLAFFPLNVACHFRFFQTKLNVYITFHRLLVFKHLGFSPPVFEIVIYIVVNTLYVYVHILDFFS